ncbi:MAG: hypothetical protein KKC68_09685 [Candidatus Thermoplasmatota archaeon]|nr:hypothetical protein [Candidatus Thermoplasmatota archaeon]MBU1942029.1 hypothetical protein [Candidatus Thermoplasmatota archaeon]
MKKIFALIAISCLLITLPLTTAYPLPHKATTYSTQKALLQTPQTIDDPPSWTIGNFTGVWGLNAMGHPLSPEGIIFGYYGQHRFLGAFTNTTAVNGYLAGITFGPFMFGVVANVTGEGRAPFVGLGGQNGTTMEFYYRIMGIVGPTFYLYGFYNPY